jgi:hypothetical protein
MTEWQIGVFAALLAIIACNTYGLTEEARKINKRLTEIASLLRRTSDDPTDY